MEETWAFIYCRISDDRLGGGLGVTRQREDCEALAERLGMSVRAVFTDNDISASKGLHRPDYEAMLSRLGEVSAVLCWHNDRLTRMPSELERYIEETGRRGVVTHAVTAGQFDLATPTGRMVARIIGATAAQESEHKAERIARKKLQNARDGLFSGGPRPFGWDIIGMDGVQSEGRVGEYVLNEREAAALATAHAEFLAGKSQGSIARGWNDPDREGGQLLTTYGKPWNRAKVANMLRRPRNAGHYDHRGEIVSRGAVPAIVSEDVWRAVVSKLDSQKGMAPKSNTPRHLLSGIAQCHCGGLVRAKLLSPGAKGRQRYVVYTCWEAGGGGHVTKRSEYADSVVEAWVYRLLAGEGNENADTPELLARIEALGAELSALAERESSAGESLAKGILTLSQVATFNASIAADRKALEEELSDLGARGANVGVAENWSMSREEADARFRDWLALPLDDRRDFVRARMNIVFHPTTPGGPRTFDPNTVSVHIRPRGGRVARLAGSEIEPLPRVHLAETPELGRLIAARMQANRAGGGFDRSRSAGVNLAALKAGSVESE